MEIIGATPTWALQKAFRQVFASGQVVSVSPMQRRDALVEHVKTLRDNGWLPMGKNVDVSAIYDGPAHSVAVTSRTA